MVTAILSVLVVSISSDWDISPPPPPPPPLPPPPLLFQVEHVAGIIKLPLVSAPGLVSSQYCMGLRLVWSSPNTAWD